MKGYIHSIQSLGTVDGPGVRAVVFTVGCPLRCAYCHNPDTWSVDGATEYEAKELVEKLRRFYPYIKGGGVTLSGGEPCLSADFLIEVVDLLHEDGIHVALDTSGSVTTDKAMALIDACDLVLLDVKFTTEEAYKRYTGGTLSAPMATLERCEAAKKPVWVRHVVVPGINDTKEDGEALRKLLSPYSVIEKIELLPFKTLCIEKYESLGIPFPLAATPAASAEDIERVKVGLGK